VGAGASTRGRGAPRLVVTALAIGIAAAGCGASTRSGSERISSRALPAATAVMTVTRAPHAQVGGVVLRGRHLRAYRRMIVALYRVPGSAAINRRFENPVDQLWHSLGKMYGPVLKPRLEAGPTTSRPRIG